MRSWTARALYVVVALGALTAEAAAALPRFVVERWTVADGLPVNALNAVLQGRDGYLWIATFDGLVRFDGARFTVFNTVSTPELPVNRIVGLIEDGAGFLWIQTELSQLVRHRHGVFERLSPPEVEALPLAETQLAVDAGGTFWALTADARYRFAAGRLADAGAAVPAPPVRRYERGAEQPPWLAAKLGLPPGTVVSHAVDHEGTVWAATSGHGLYALKPARVAMLTTADGLAGDNVYPVHQDRSGTIWIGDHGGGLTRLDGGRLTAFPSVVEDEVLTIFDDPATGELFLGTWEGLFRAAGRGMAGQRVERLTDPSGPVGPVTATWAIHRDADGRLLLGTWFGLWRSRAGDPVAGAWRFRQVAGTETWKVRRIFEDGEGTVWLGTNGHGLARYRDGRLTRLGAAEGLPSDLVRDVYLDDEGFLWIATEDRGLAHLEALAVGEEETPRIAVVDQRHGLCDNSLHRILSDGRGWLWMSSNRGIFRLRADQLTAVAKGERERVDCVVYTERDGMASREANGGVQGAGIRARDGRLLFPTQGGLAVLDPEALTRGLPPPPVHVERLLVGEREVRAEGGAVVLSPGERGFRVEYTALSFRSPERVRFAYRLEGFDNAWQDAGSRRSTVYTRMPPGRYVFRVRGRSSEGMWNEEGASLALFAQPYFYETGWFHTASAAAALALLVLGIRQRESRQRRRRHELERLVAERTEQLARQAEKLSELDRTKSELFANVSHEFRTPLTLALGPLEDVGAGRYGPIPEAASRELALARANALRMLELVNQLLDVARLDAGGLELRVQREDLAAFLRYLKERFTPLAERRRIELSCRTPQGPVWVWIDPEQLEKVFANLLANALKFTPKHGRVSIELEAPAEGWVTARVADSGSGIAAEQASRIFERFFQGDSSARRRHPGTGLGLALARDLVELHGGALEVASAPGQGSAFSVRLRCGRDHFSADQVSAEEEPHDGAPASDDRLSALGAVLAELESEEIAKRGPANRGPAKRRPANRGPAKRGPANRRPANRHPEGRAASPEAAATGTDDRTTVLVVDDHPDLRAYVRRHLEEVYRVVEAADGAAALVRARELLPDLVVSDVMMPEMDGFELCRSLKRDPELDFVPVILLTARASAEAKLAGLGEGADDYLTKPFDVRELRLRVDNLLASRRRLRDLLRERRGAPESAEESSEAAFVERLRALVDEHLANEGFQVDDLASGLAMSRSRLYARMEELVGQTPARWILERRLERAAELLAGREGSVSEVAYAVGFKSVSHFSQSFRESYGVSPSSYRRSAA